MDEWMVAECQVTLHSMQGSVLFRRSRRIDQASRVHVPHPANRGVQSPSAFVSTISHIAVPARHQGIHSPRLESQPDSECWKSIGPGMKRAAAYGLRSCTALAR